MIGTVHFNDGHVEKILLYDGGFDGIRTYFTTESGQYKRHLTSNPEQNGKYIYSKLLMHIGERKWWVVVNNIEKIELEDDFPNCQLSGCEAASKDCHKTCPHGRKEQ